MTKSNKRKVKKKVSPKFVDVRDVHCPICKGVINDKWFNFRSGNVIEFIAECWSGDLNVDSPRHIFYFQIETPECVIVHGKGSKAFND